MYRDKNMRKLIDGEYEITKPRMFRNMGYEINDHYTLEAYYVRPFIFPKDEKWIFYKKYLRM